MDTEMTKGLEMKKVSPCLVVEAALTGLEGDREEALADEFTRKLKRSLSNKRPIYLEPPEISSGEWAQWQFTPREFRRRLRILVPIRRMSPGWRFREAAGDESRVRTTFRCGTPTLGGRGRGRGHLLIHAECWPFLAGPESPTTPALQSRAQLWGRS